MLSRAIAVLQPAAVDPSENAAVVKELQNFIKHDDTAVRAQAIGTLAAWDKTGESAATLRQALGDPSEEVRWAAITAIAENRIRSDTLKSALINIANNANESPNIRLTAANALERFALAKEEYANVIQSAKEADRQMNLETASFQ
jgi:HEAT repeat protein